MEPYHKVFAHNKHRNGLSFTLYLDKMDSYILTSKAGSEKRATSMCKINWKNSKYK